VRQQRRDVRREVCTQRRPFAARRARLPRLRARRLEELKLFETRPSSARCFAACVCARVCVRLCVAAIHSSRSFGGKSKSPAVAVPIPLPLAFALPRRDRASAPVPSQPCAVPLPLSSVLKRIAPLAFAGPGRLWKSSKQTRHVLRAPCAPNPAYARPAGLPGRSHLTHTAFFATTRGVSPPYFTPPPPPSLIGSTYPLVRTNR